MPFRISVIIPTLDAAGLLPGLLNALREQTTPAYEIIVIDSSSEDGTAKLATSMGCIVEQVPKASFSHGGSRNEAAKLAAGEILVFMTQDALPASPRFLEELSKPILAGHAASFARQIPNRNAAPPEVFARTFNYPPVSRVTTDQDIRALGIRAYFFSNVSSAVLAERFWAAGGFPARVILNEDMLLSARLLRLGFSVAYQSEAVVYHSHAYSLVKQFRRYFDIGAAIRQAGDALGAARSSGEGSTFALQQLLFLAKRGAWQWIPRTLAEIGVKFIAFNLGKHEAHLPVRFKRVLSMNPAYWEQNESVPTSMRHEPRRGHRPRGRGHGASGNRGRYTA